MKREEIIVGQTYRNPRIDRLVDDEVLYQGVLRKGRKFLKIISGIGRGKLVSESCRVRNPQFWDGFVPAKEPAAKNSLDGMKAIMDASAALGKAKREYLSVLKAIAADKAQNAVVKKTAEILIARS